MVKPSLCHFTPVSFLNNPLLKCRHFNPLLLKFWSENNRSLHNNRFCPPEKIPARKPDAESIYHSYLIMHMGGSLIKFGMKGELVIQLCFSTCSCCHCCLSQCALPTQCPIGHLVNLNNSLPT